MTSDDLTNKQLGPYLLTAPLGKGGMATVYLARQPSMDRDVAIKVMARELADDPQFVDRFENEAQMIANLQHPHILPVIDFGREGQNIYIVMQLVRGGSLDDRLKRGPLDLKLASRMLGQIASALTFAPEQGIVHRDLKPNNVLLDERSNAYLTDFGIAKMLAGTTKLTATGHILGTPAYMAPEQWQGGTVDARTDIYALGVMAYEMVVGRLPFAGDTPYTLMFQHVNDAPPPPRQLNPGIKPSVEAVILRALSKDPADRYQSAEAMADEFDAAVRQPAAAAPPPPADDLAATALGSMISTPPPGTPPPGTPPRSTPPRAAAEAEPTIIESPGQPPRPTPVPPARAAGGGPAAPTRSATPESAPPSRSRTGRWAALAAVIVLAGAGLVFALTQLGGKNEPTQVASAPTATETATVTATDTLEPTATDTPTATATDTPAPTNTPTTTPTDTPEPTSTPRTTFATVLSQRLSVRTSPDANSGAIATLDRDTEVIVIGVSEDGNWYQIAVPGAGAGWVPAELVRISGNPNIPVIVLPTATPTPTATDTATATPTATQTPEPPPTLTPVPTAVPLPTATIDSRLYVPTAYTRATVPELGLSFEYPTTWASIFYSPVLGYASLKPQQDVDFERYPWVRIARGAPEFLLEKDFTEDISSPGAAVESMFVTDSIHTLSTANTYPIYEVMIPTPQTRYWGAIIVVGDADWVMIRASVPTLTALDDEFMGQTLFRIVSSLQIDGVPLVRTGTAASPTPIPSPPAMPTALPAASPTVPPSPTLVPSPTALPATPSTEITSDLFAPPAFRRGSLPILHITLDLPSAWVEPQRLGATYILRPVGADHPLRAAYPAVVIARGHPDALRQAQTTTDPSSPEAALEHTLGLPLTGLVRPSNAYTVPALEVRYEEAERLIWSLMLVLGENDWLHVIAIVPRNNFTTSFMERSLPPIIQGMAVDGVPIIRAPEEPTPTPAAPPPLRPTLTPAAPSVITEPPIALGTPVLDRFGDEAREWMFADEIGEELILAAPELDLVRWAMLPELPADRPAYYFQATVRLVSETDFYRLGLGFNGQDDDTFYLYAIDHAGTVAFEYVDNWKRTPIIPLFQPDSANTDPGAKNTLGVLVMGGYIELYLNGEFVTAAFDSDLLVGSLRLITFTFSDSNKPVIAAFDDVAYLPLDPAPGTSLAAQNTVIWGTIRSAPTNFTMRPVVGAERIGELNPGALLAVLGRTADERMVYGYAQGSAGWLPANRVTLSLNGLPVPLANLPIIAPAITGVEVRLWPVIWPD